MPCLFKLLVSCRSLHVTVGEGKGGISRDTGLAAGIGDKAVRIMGGEDPRLSGEATSACLVLSVSANKGRECHSTACKINNGPTVRHQQYLQRTNSLSCLFDTKNSIIPTGLWPLRSQCESCALLENNTFCIIM